MCDSSADLPISSYTPETTKLTHTAYDCCVNKCEPWPDNVSQWAGEKHGLMTCCRLNQLGADSSLCGRTSILGMLVVRRALSPLFIIPSLSLSDPCLFCPFQREWLISIQVAGRPNISSDQLSGPKQQPFYSLVCQPILFFVRLCVSIILLSCFHSCS